MRRILAHPVAVAFVVLELALVLAATMLSQPRHVHAVAPSDTAQIP